MNELLPIEVELQSIVQAIQEAVEQARHAFIALGYNFARAKTSGCWQPSCESWGQFCEQFHFTVKYVDNLISLYEWSRKLALDDSRLKEIGISRFEAVLPRLKRAKTPEEREAILEDAEHASVLDLRISPRGEREMTVCCIQCGEAITRCPKCGNEIKVRYR